MDETLSTVRNVFAGFLADQLSRTIMGMISGSYPTTPNLIDGEIDAEKTRFGFDNITVDPNNTLGCYLDDLAKLAISNNASDPTSRAAYDAAVAAGDGHWDQDLTHITTSLAVVYDRSMNILRTIVGRDAQLTLRLIQTDLEKRLGTVTDGGVVKGFTWGILSNGLWLNNALTIAYDREKLFHPDSPVVAYYATSAFNAVERVAPEPLPLNDQALIESRLTTLLQAANSDVDASEVVEALESPDGFAQKMSIWARQLNDPMVTVRGVEYLSNLYEIADNIRKINKQVSASGDGGGMVLPDDIANRLNAFLLQVTFGLLGFYALRETQFAKTVIMDIIPDAESSTRVTVIVNEDNIDAYHQAGGSDTDLIRAGQFFNPNKGLKTPPSGYELGYLIENRERIGSEAIASEYDRQKSQEAADRDAVYQAATDRIAGIVQSYIEAAGSEQVSVQFFNSRIADVVSAITSGEGNDAMSAIMGILTEAAGQRTMYDLYTALCRQVKAGTTLPESRAILDVAIDDIGRMVTGTYHETGELTRDAIAA